MTLIITGACALVAIALRLGFPSFTKRYHIGSLALMYSGASLMWCIDGFAALAEGEPFVELGDAAAMADDALLGICVVVLGLIVWGVILFVKREKPNRITA